MFSLALQTHLFVPFRGKSLQGPLHLACLFMCRVKLTRHITGAPSHCRLSYNVWLGSTNTPFRTVFARQVTADFVPPPRPPKRSTRIVYDGPFVTKYGPTRSVRLEWARFLPAWLQYSCRTRKSCPIFLLHGSTITQVMATKTIILYLPVSSFFVDCCYQLLLL